MRTLLFILSLLSCTTLLAQQTTPVDYGTEKNMPAFYEQLKAELTFPWSWQNKHDAMSFAAWKAEARQQVESTMQLAPPAPDNWDYTVIATEQRDGYKAQKIRFNINKWENVMAYLLVPDGTGKTATSLRGKSGETTFPALLMLHDHGAHFAIGKEKMVRPFGVDSTLTADADHWAEICYDGKFVGDELAKAGYVVLSIDALLWGDRSRKEDRTDIAGALATKERKQQTYDAQQALASNLLQMGTSWGAWITWDDIRAAHFLSQLPMVDKERVGCLGFSMGAYRSWMLAALSDDIKASASVCWMNDTEHLMSLTNNQNKGGSAYSMLIPGIRNVMDYPHVASMACPKPALFYNGERDKLFPVEGVQNAYQTMHEVWKAQNADDKLVTKIWPEKHFLNRAMQDSILLFFNKYLDNTPAKPGKKAKKNIPCHAAPPLVEHEDMGAYIRWKGDSIVKTIQQVSIPDNFTKVSPYSPYTDLTKNAQPKLQAAIDKMVKKGGGKVIVEEGVYYLCGPLKLYSNIELHLDSGAIVKFSGNARHFLPVVRTRFEGTDLWGRCPMIYACDAENIAITGEGTIDGRAGREMAAWGMVPESDSEDWHEIMHGTHGETIEMPDVRRLRQMGDDNTPMDQRVFADTAKLRPCMVEFINCKRILLEDFTLKYSPFWCIHPVYCSDVIVRHVTIHSNFPNNDGCDPESSRNVLIENCYFDSGDDGVAIKSGRDADGRRVGKPSENIVVRHCYFDSKCNGLCIGSEMSGGVNNVVVHDIGLAHVKNGLLFKTNMDRGGVAHDVWIDSVKIEYSLGALLRFETNYFGWRGGDYPSQFENFYISNVSADRCDGWGIFYDGPGMVRDGQVVDKNPKYAIRNITVKNFVANDVLRPWYLYNTDNCRFINCSINGSLMPEQPKEDDVRQECDVW